MTLVSLLTLAVPLIGWQSVSQLYVSLQNTRIEEQTLSSENLRASLIEQASLRQLLIDRNTNEQSQLWFAESASLPLFVDGYSDDWRTLISPATRFEKPRLSLSVRVARRAQRLFLFLQVRDDFLVWHRPPALIVDPGEGEQLDVSQHLSTGDAIELLLQAPRQAAQHVLVRAIAPGELQPLVASQSDKTAEPLTLAGDVKKGWKGAWTVTSDGYQVELELPMPASGTRIAISSIDLDADATLVDVDAANSNWVGSMSPDWMKRIHAGGAWPAAFPGAVVQQVSSEAVGRLRPWLTPGSRIRMFAVDGSLVADVNALYERDTAVEVPLWDSLLYRLFAWFVAGDLPLIPEEYKRAEPLHLDQERRLEALETGLETTRYVTADNDRVLGTLAPLSDQTQALYGYLLFESNEEHRSAYSGSRLARLFSLLLLVSLLAGSALLIYAITLSVRIRRLSNQARVAVSRDGRPKSMPVSRARDEIGDLSRDLSSLLSRSAAYTDYLEALSSRLSHELKTPLSVVRTSIENVDRKLLDDQSLILIDRANEGAEQLAGIIRALVESTRLEQIVQGASQAELDLQQFADKALKRYQQVYPDTRIELLPGKRSRIIASVELLQQALDKLVDNACDFAIDDEVRLEISIQMLATGPCVCLAVANTGTLQERDEPRDTAHLGLGLAIVRMVAEAHGGQAIIEQQSDELLIGMRFPVNTHL